MDVEKKIDISKYLSITSHLSLGMQPGINMGIINGAPDVITEGERERHREEESGITHKNFLKCIVVRSFG